MFVEICEIRLCLIAVVFLYFADALCTHVDYKHNHVIFEDGDVLGKCSCGL